MDNELLSILACPHCKGKLRYIENTQELICTIDRIAYPVKDGIPFLLEANGRLITQQELDALKF